MSGDCTCPNPRCPEHGRIYPCDNCGTMRTKDEGGTTFTVCDDCWDNLHPPEGEERET